METAAQAPPETIAPFLATAFVPILALLGVLFTGSIVQWGNRVSRRTDISTKFGPRVDEAAAHLRATRYQPQFRALFQDLHRQVSASITESGEIPQEAFDAVVGMYEWDKRVQTLNDILAEENGLEAALSELKGFQSRLTNLLGLHALWMVASAVMLVVAQVVAGSIGVVVGAVWASLWAAAWLSLIAYFVRHYIRADRAEATLDDRLRTIEREKKRHEASPSAQSGTA